jgi:chaperone modulatory protein CbpM
MSRFYTETEVIALIEDLDEGRLQAFLAAHVVTPVATPAGPGYREADLARLHLLCDLVDCYEMPADGLTLVMSLLDQLNTARGDMRALMQAVAAEPDEVRLRIHRVIHDMRG